MDKLASEMGLRAKGAKALVRYLHDEMAAGRIREGVKLPPERALSEQFGASRGAVRRVLAEFRALGLITQVVGSGTFASAAAETMRLPDQASDEQVDTSPLELMEARILIEPLMPTLIVGNATSADFLRMNECIEQSEAAASIEQFEYWDGELHRSFAIATHNSFFLQLLELMNRIRQQGEWGRLKRISLTAETRHRYEQQHRAIVDALKDRDADEARTLLTEHLVQIKMNLFGY